MDSSVVIAKTEEAEAKFQEWMALEGSTAGAAEIVAKRAQIHHEVMASLDDPDHSIRVERYRNGLRFTFSQKRQPEA